MSEPAAWPVTDGPRHPEAVWAVLDVETTGLSAARHRVLEIAVVGTDAAGAVLDEWCTRLDPEGSVGATDVHGITDDDVRGAPLFADVADELVERLRGRVIVAHNAQFDLGFLRAELARAGRVMPDPVVLCTMEASRHYLPLLPKRRLIDCCTATGVSLVHAHSALGDARATAALLRAYLDPARGAAPRPADLALPARAQDVVWG